MFRSKKLQQDIDAIRDRDPAARSDFEVIALYQGLKAVRSHRKAHWFYKHNMLFLARWISQRTVSYTHLDVYKRQI